MKGDKKIIALSVTKCLAHTNGVYPAEGEKDSFPISAVKCTFSISISLFLFIFFKFYSQLECVV